VRLTLDWSRGALAEGLGCYRREEFFLAHEHWEAVWLGAEEPEKTFLQALIQVTAAFHHLQRENGVGARSLLRAALRRLEGYPAWFGGVDVARLREELGFWVRGLEEGGVRGDYPVIVVPPPPHDLA
jgi:predicted metal-dependent hydrolase